MGRKPKVDEDFLKVKEAYLKNQPEHIMQDYYDYLSKETGLTKKICYEQIIKVLMEKKYK